MIHNRDPYKMFTPNEALRAIKKNDSLSARERFKAVNLIIANKHQEPFKIFCKQKLYTLPEKTRMLKKSEKNSELAFNCLKYMPDLNDEEIKELTRCILCDANTAFEYITTYDYTPEQRKSAFMRIKCFPYLCIDVLRQLELSEHERKIMFNGILTSSTFSGQALSRIDNIDQDTRNKLLKKMLEETYACRNFLLNNGEYNEEERQMILSTIIEDKGICFTLLESKKKPSFEIMKPIFDKYGLKLFNDLVKTNPNPFTFFFNCTNTYFDDENIQKYINHILKKRWYGCAVEIEQLIQNGQFDIGNKLEDKIIALIVEGKLSGKI